MTHHKAPGTHRYSARGDSGRTFSSVRVLAVIGLAAVLATGCGSSGPTKAPTGSRGASAAASAATPIATGQALSQDVPPGREIAEGGGGPVSYTFREEWRRALAEAQKWRSGAYLIKGVGNLVNDDGVPNYWALAFIDKAEADAVLRVEIDPWGKVTKTQEVTGSGVISFVDQYTKRIPYDVIDSDEAVALGKAALATHYDLVKTKDPLLSLSSDALTGGALRWTYMLFYESTAEYVSAQIDAVTGEVMPPK
jgi:hypothetical protein